MVFIDLFLLLQRSTAYWWYHLVWNLLFAEDLATIQCLLWEEPHSAWTNFVNVSSNVRSVDNSLSHQEKRRISTDTDPLCFLPLSRAVCSHMYWFIDLLRAAALVSLFPPAFTFQVTDLVLWNVFPDFLAIGAELTDFWVFFLFWSEYCWLQPLPHCSPPVSAFPRLYPMFQLLPLFLSYPSLAVPLFCCPATATSPLFMYPRPSYRAF